MPAKFSLKILRGVGLLAQDVHLLSENSSDPYCVVSIDGRQVARTPVVHQTLEPIWGGPGATVEFAAADDPEIVIEIYDHDVLKADDPMGQVRFRPGALLAIVAEQTPQYPNVWLPVQPLDDCEATGSLEVRLLYHEESNDDGSDDEDGVVGGAIECALGKSPAPQMTPSRRHRPPRELKESALSALSAGPKLSECGMGGTLPSLRRLLVSSEAPVTLHIYDVSHDPRIGHFNALAKSLNGGIYHAAVEVYGREFSFGGSKLHTTGIFACQPRKCPMHRYRESLYLGDCDLTPDQVDQIIAKMKPEWMAPTYDLLRKNCVFFSREFVAELGCGDIPEYIYKLASMGAALDDYYSGTAREEKKAGEGHMVASVGPSAKKAAKKEKAPEWGLPPTRSESQQSLRTKDKSNKISKNELLDDVMAARVQRAYRASIIQPARYR